MRCSELCSSRPAQCLVALLLLLASPAAAQLCAGDCDGDGQVTVDEMIDGVNIALQRSSIDSCRVFDRNDNGAVDIEELVEAVEAVMRGCPGKTLPPPAATATDLPTATPTSTDPPPPPTSTPTPTATATIGAGTECASLQPPASFGEGFVDLTADVESDLVPIAEPPLDVPPYLSFAFFNDVDGDGIMEVFVGQENTAVVALLRYEPSTGRLIRDLAADLPTFDVFFGVIDVDSDGIADLFGQRSARPLVAWGRGDGTFEEPADVFPEPIPQTFYRSPYFADFDSDGWLDLVVGGLDCNDPNTTVRVLFADGNRHWSRRDDVIPSELRIFDGLVFTAPLAGADNIAAVLGGECEYTEVPIDPRFFVPSLEASGRPVWTPDDVIESHPGEPELPNPLSAPMGAAVGDLDGDGRFELAISGNPVLGMWRGTDAAPMLDITDRTNMKVKIGDRGVPLIPWSVLFVDLDRDGRLDVFVTHGDDYLAQELRHIGKQWATAYWNGGNLCGYEISEALNITRRGDWRTLAVGDLEGDGLPDLAVGGRGEQPRILHNRIDTGNQGFGLRLRGTTSNPYGIGARVEVTVGPDEPVQHQVVGGFYPVATVVEPLLFVGLGNVSAAERVRITWPSGLVQELHDVPAGALHTITEPSLIEIEPASRHIRAGSNDVATICVTPRDSGGGVRADANVEVAVVTGDATLAAPAVWTGSEWQAQVAPGAAAGSSVIEVRVDGHALGIRPRIWFDGPDS